MSGLSLGFLAGYMEQGIPPNSGDQAVRVTTAAGTWQPALPGSETPLPVPENVPDIVGNSSDKPVNLSSAGQVNNLAHESPISEFPTTFSHAAGIEALETQPVDQAVDGLLSMLEDKDPDVRREAAESLVDLDPGRALSGLVKALDDRDASVRVIALEGLGASGDVQQAVYIEPHLHDRSAEVRSAAIEALTELEPGGSVHALAGLLSDPDPAIRRQAVDALAVLGGEVAPAYLEQARHDPSASVRAIAEAELAERALESLN